MIAFLLFNLVFGAIVGYAGRLVLPGAQNISVFQTIFIGLAAAAVGVFLFWWLWWPLSMLFTVVCAAAGIKVGMSSGFLKEKR